VGALDEKANKILDKLLDGMSESKKTSMKFSLDWRLNLRRDEAGNFLPDENGFFVIDMNKSNSKNSIINKIDSSIKHLKEPGQDDMLGVLNVLQKLKKLYLEEYSPLDLKA
jgi:hypothetical protein